jgi:anti-sigma-K factor RskA
MHDKLVGYLLGSLDSEEVSDVEKLLAENSEIRRDLETLRRALDPLEGDRQHVDAPEGLASRTCQQIRELRQSEKR